MANPEETIFFFLLYMLIVYYVQNKIQVKIV